MLGLIWVALVILVNPIGDFPLNDDWSYGKSVYYLVKEGTLRFTGWQGVTLVAQIFWGALFCLPFGFSFTALRLSTLFLGLTGIFAAYALFRQKNINHTVAFIAASLIAINPLYFALSNTFMTDVPFFAFAMVSLFFFIRGIRLERKGDILIGTLSACIATLIRQPGIIIPLSFGIGYLCKNGIRKKTVQTALLPAVLVIGTYLSYYFWLKNTLGLSELYFSFKNILISFLIKPLKPPIRSVASDICYQVLVAFIYLGLFLFPLLILKNMHRWKTPPYEKIFGSFFGLFVIFSALTAMLLHYRQIMPLSRNILCGFGFGVATLRDIYILGLPHLPNAPKTFWILVTIIGLFGAAMLLQDMFSALTRVLYWRGGVRPLADKWFELLVISAYSFYFVPIVILLGYFDRYLIPLLPLSVLFIMKTEDCDRLHLDRLSFYIVGAILIIYCMLTVGAAHDYLAWNRARWKALHDLTEKDGISYKCIDGGLEFNGWYAYDPKYIADNKKSWWWVDRDDYVISFGPIPGYKDIRRYPYKRWIPFRWDYIFVLHRSASD